MYNLQIKYSCLDACELFQTSTAVLLTPDKMFKAFGFDAEKLYENESWYLFRDFKMKLYTVKVMWNVPQRIDNMCSL